MDKRKEKRPRAEKKPKRVAPKKSSNGSSDVGKAVLSIIIILIDVIILIAVHQNKLNIQKEDKIVEASTVEVRREMAEKKIQSLPQLAGQIDELSGKLKPQMKNYFGNDLQEHVIYCLNELQKEADITIDFLSFLPPTGLLGISPESQPSDEGMEGNTEDDEPQTEETPDDEANNFSNITTISSYISTEVDDASNSENESGLHMAVDTMNVSLGISGTYKSFMKFLSLIDKNEKKISVSGVELTPVKSFLSLENNEEELVDTEQYITAAVSLIFYSIPSVENYIEIEDLYTWEYDLSVKNPFDGNNLMDKVHNKFDIYEFANGNQSVDVRNTNSSSVSLEKQNDSDGLSVVSLKYNFGENDENPMILVDLKSENISVEKADKIGIEMHSDGSNKGRIHIILSDSNNSEVAVEITDEIYWKGWVNLDARINQTMTFPIRVTGIMVSQQGVGEELEPGSLKFKKIFSATKIQDEENKGDNVDE